jgi:hypothetical protein
MPSCQVVEGVKINLESGLEVGPDDAMYSALWSSSQRGSARGVEGVEGK